MDLSIGDTQLIIKECRNYSLSRQEAAYVLATAYWETARTMKPVREAYWLSETWRRDNLRNYPWYGRGYVQLTWEYNYEKASAKTGVDLIENPDRAMEPSTAATVLVIGSKEGWFTGKKLSDYITSEKKDYRNARRIINGTDKANTIAVIAEQYEGALHDYEAKQSIASLLVKLLKGLLRAKRP